MVVIHRAHGLRFVIYTMDHGPAHVHVIGDSELKVNLAAGDGHPEIVWSTGMSASDRRRAMAVIREKQDEFLARWREIHGDER
jgi:hypothetical protein